MCFLHFSPWPNLLSGGKEKQVVLILLIDHCASCCKVSIGCKQPGTSQLVNKPMVKRTPIKKTPWLGTVYQHAQAGRSQVALPTASNPANVFQDSKASFTWKSHVDNVKERTACLTAPGESLISVPLNPQSRVPRFCSAELQWQRASPHKSGHTWGWLNLQHRPNILILHDMRIKMHKVHTCAPLTWGLLQPHNSNKHQQTI